MARVYSLSISFDSPRLASIVENTIKADEEPSEDRIKREIWTEDSKLWARWTSEDVKLLRTCVSSFYDSAILVAKTIKAFAP
mmetsp:Transcript_25546/g.44574  ORF Transcript_25546/g.44574 Transcript_25546/m.44574 type:complete len:82 (-) Transcript_25546:210-455(-)